MQPVAGPRTTPQTYPHMTLNNTKVILAALVATQVIGIAVAGLIEKNPFKRVERKYGELGVTLYICVVGPILEELIYRCRLQQDIIPKLIEKGLRWINKEELTKHPMYTHIRIIMTAALFSLVHLTNIPIAGREETMKQVISSFPGGIIFGYLAEKNGIAASCIAHALHNSVTWARVKYHEQT